MCIALILATRGKQARPPAGTHVTEFFLSLSLSMFSPSLTSFACRFSRQRQVTLFHPKATPRCPHCGLSAGVWWSTTALTFAAGTFRPRVFQKSCSKNLATLHHRTSSTRCTESPSGPSLALDQKFTSLLLLSSSCPLSSLISGSSSFKSTRRAAPSQSSELTTPALFLILRP